jgi:hypothetical protein
MNFALLGVCNNISQNLGKVKVWSQSFKAHCPHDVVLLCADSSEAELSAVRRLGVEAISVDMDNPLQVNHERLGSTLNFLKSCSYDALLVTDVFDVCFQADPFSKLNFESFNLFLGSEGVLVSEEPWNCDNITKLFPDHISFCLSNDVVCSGVMAGDRKSLIELYSKLSDLCKSSTELHDIKDQAALIVLLSCLAFPNLRIKVFTPSDGWTLHCAVGGPTDLFEGWGFKACIESRYGLPRLNALTVETSEGQPYDIVHQFNRVPDWHPVVIAPYV